LNLVETVIHFVGIGGIGMSGIAEVLTNMGCRVSGSDVAEGSQVERLRAMGISVKIGHAAGNIPRECNAVVYSSAVAQRNPELKEARKRKIPVIQRAEMLAELMRLKRGIAIAGTHGKTTTTSMVAAIMLSAKLDPTIVVGGRLDLIKSTASLGKGEWFVAEADESDASFLRLSPEIITITNIDNDHLDHYGSIEKLVEAYSEFAAKVPFYGLAIFCIDDPRVEKLSRAYEKRQITYGLSAKARLRARNLRLVVPEAVHGGAVSNSSSNSFGLAQEFDVDLDGKRLGSLRLNVPGNHNVLNALAAIAVGLELKLDFEAVSMGLSEFRGVDRRLQVRGQCQGALVIDDYGHHPTEVAATLQALRSAFEDRRIIVVFQPHRYTRTETCWDQFLKSFDAADVVGLLDIYAASEKPIKGITSEKLSRALAKKHKGIRYWGSHRVAMREIGKLLNGSAGDLILTLGAGDVWKIGVELAKEI
jgi:UDP-N-acetylmuramate--alanine ligase